ncbi:MAG: glycerophosphodiester phosphodiesterase family protein, partial [Planctomycetota bacterium]
MISSSLVAHRGYAGRHPENTRASVQAALDLGTRWIEIDLQLTKDEVVVLYHDRTLDRVSGTPGAVHLLDWAELEGLNVSEPERLSDFESATNAEPIVRLEEIAELGAQNSETRWFLEVKRVAIEAHGVDVVLDRVLEAAAPLEGRFVLISFSCDFLEAARERTAAPIAPILEDWSQLSSARLQAMEPEWVFCNRTRLPEAPTELPRDEPRMVIYEVTDAEEALSYLQRGAELIETFDLEDLN